MLQAQAFGQRQADLAIAAEVAGGGQHQIAQAREAHEGFGAGAQGHAESGDLGQAARNPLLIVNDADIRVEPDYIARVTGPLADPKIGLVTCLYRAEGDTFAARFEGLGIATDFAPSTLVARMVGVDEFAMGSTMAFRRETLDRIGGFDAISTYLADDYQLGQRIHSLGLKCMLSDVIVTTHLGGGWRDVWLHQVRRARTIREPNFSGYVGCP